MNPIIAEAAKAVAGVLALMAGWVLVQGYIRKHSGCGASQDVLEPMAHGCGGCARPCARGNHHESQ